MPASAVPDRLAPLRAARLFVLDLDGTVYLGDSLLPSALAFRQAAEETGRDYLFFTNNTSRSPEDTLQKLARLGWPVGRERLLTSGDVTLHHLRTRRPGQSVYLVGTPALRRSFEEAGVALLPPDTDRQPDAVVVGFDTTLTYPVLERACTFIRRGAAFLATHPDVNCPVPGGFLPDCGAICAAIALSTGQQPRCFGKPYPETAEMIAEFTCVPRAQLAFVGDRLYTDIAAGVNNGALGLLVMTGETTPALLAESAVQPDGVYASLGEIGQLLRAL